MTRLCLNENQARFVADVLTGELGAVPSDFVNTVATGEGFLAWAFAILGGRPLVLSSDLSFHWNEANFNAEENERIRTAAKRLVDLAVELGLQEAEVGHVATPGARVRPSGLAEHLLTS